MKATGMTRKIDELGRVCLPIELRNNLDIKEKDSLEIYVDKDAIILKKFIRGCVKCSSVENLVDIDGNDYCHSCARKLAATLKRCGIS